MGQRQWQRAGACAWQDTGMDYERVMKVKGVLGSGTKDCGGGVELVPSIILV